MSADTRTTPTTVRLGVQSGLRHVRVALWCYVLTSMLVLPVMLAVGAAVHGYVGHSLSAGRFAEGVDAFLIGGLLRDRAPALMAMVPVLLGVLVLFAGLSVFSSGAILTAVQRATPMPTAALFAAGGRHFWRLVRLAFFGLPFCALLVGIPAVIATKIVGRLVEDSVSEVGTLAARATLVAFVALVFAFANAVYDLMRVEAVVGDEPRARWAFVMGVVRGFSNPWRLMKTYLPFAIVAVGLTVLGSLLDARFARTSAGAIVLGVVLQQFVTFSRTMIRIGLAGAEVALTRRL